MTENETRSTSRKLASKIWLGALLLLACGLLTFWLPRSTFAAILGLRLPRPPIGMICEFGDDDTTPTFDLETAADYIATPDGNSLFMWGFNLAGEPFQIPGPVLCVDEGDTVTVNLTNNLPEPVSIIFPGQAGVTASGGVPGFLTAEAAANGGTVSYSFTASQPGTYLYESGANPYKQVHMGLYGALVVYPSMGRNFAYNDPDTEFAPEKEYLIVIHEIDPFLHFAVENGYDFDVTTRHDRYWNINGRSFPDTIAANDAPWLPNQPYGALVIVEASPPEMDDLPALIRYANAGTVIHPFHPHGNSLRVIAKDGRLLVGPGGEDLSVEAFTKSISAGQTMDLLFRWVDIEEWDPDENPIPITVDLPVPGLQNLVFKDDLTFYSGSYYLGYKDELPVGTTSYNQCGEFYFPWHSHALNEFQSFDEGFSGLATAVLVLPPGGCP